MPYYQSNTLKYALCSNSFPLSGSEGEVLERICSKLGGGLERAIVPVDSPVVAIEGPYATRAGELQDMVLRNMDCVNINSEYTTIDSHFSIIDDLKIVNNQETDLYFYHSDHLGSSSFITDADGIVSQHLQYLPYGELFAEQRDNTARYYTPYKFSGKEKDEETGYSYFGARYYMPELSIWSAVDVMTDERTWLSPYNYCQNNPVMLTDPNGMLDDGYVVDECGYFTKVDNTGGDDYDIIYSNNKDGTPNLDASKSLHVDKGIIQNMSQGINYGYGFDKMEVGSAEKGRNLFEFLTKNSKVEWAVDYFKKGSSELSVVMTSHDKDVQRGCVALDSKYLSYDFIGEDHSHPDGNWQPSSATMPIGDPSRKQGDIGVATLLENKRNKNAIFNIYDRETGTYFRYNSQTVIPYSIEPFEIIESKLKK